MYITIEMETGNAEFCNARHVAKALRELAAKISDVKLEGDTVIRIKDVNGNTVGTYKVKEL